MLPAWGFWGVFLTLAELAVGIGLLLGVASRLAAVGGLLLIAPIWIMLWHTHLYLWEYPAEDLFPLLLLAIAPARRHFGMDGRLVKVRSPVAVLNRAVALNSRSRLLPAGRRRCR